MNLIILDRDGVINHDSDNYIRTVDDWIPIAGSLEAIARLNQAGYDVVVATNQSGIGRGYFNHATLNAIHQKMHQALALVGGHIDGILFCPHTPDDNCQCRKPKAGMYQEIANRWGYKLQDVPVIGDSRRDLEAAITVGATPILVRTGKGSLTLKDMSGLEAATVYDDLAAAVGEIINP